MEVQLLMYRPSSTSDVKQERIFEDLATVYVLHHHQRFHLLLRARAPENAACLALAGACSSSNAASICRDYRLKSAALEGNQTTAKVILPPYNPNDAPGRILESICWARICSITRAHLGFRRSSFPGALCSAYQFRGLSKRGFPICHTSSSGQHLPHYRTTTAYNTIEKHRRSECQQIYYVNGKEPPWIVLEKSSFPLFFGTADEMNRGPHRFGQ